LTTAPQLSLARYAVALRSEIDFSGWRDAARRLVLNCVSPEEVTWAIDPVHATDAAASLPTLPADAVLNVRRSFLARAEDVICHSDPARFAFLYKLLWRLAREPELAKIASDPDVRRLEAMEKAVHRDIHKMRAFVRFRRLKIKDSESYVAWFEPSHFILERNSEFFVRRFAGMRWMILTPYASAEWDGEMLSFGRGASKTDLPRDDDTEELWKTYFTSIFNPSRLKVKAMQSEMPKKYWRNLPEASLIPQMIAGAHQAAREMIARLPSPAPAHHERIQARHWKHGQVAVNDGHDATTIAELKEAAKACRICPLWRDATQTVFGEGPSKAKLVFVGEQPGDYEDLVGKPFVGPAGQIFDATLAEAEIDRAQVYVTNAVKHFKFEPRGKRRIHRTPNAREVEVCRWWLDHELALIEPELVVALGASAAQSLLGRPIAVTKMRGETIEREDGLKVFITIHPSFILRIPDADTKQAERTRFIGDMRKLRKFADL
jgi:DNA polymerase